LSYELQAQVKGLKMVTGGARGKRRRWRTAKSTPKLQKMPKQRGKKTFPGGGCLRDEQPDRLVLSALKYWEVKRNLIEERLATKSATAAS
jgi:hypothetical protein